jgi:flagellar motor switch protein FliN
MEGRNKIGNLLRFNNLAARRKSCRCCNRARNLVFGRELQVQDLLTDGNPVNLIRPLVELATQRFNSGRIRINALARDDRKRTDIVGVLCSGRGWRLWFLMAIAVEGVDLLSVLSSELRPGAIASAPTSVLQANPLEGVNTKNLDLLLDVELPISVSFRRAQLLLKDVIKLTTGSIVELNRAVSEPVDIIVNNCVIARGEVVVVEGNFGVPIKQIVSKQERLKPIA